MQRWQMQRPEQAEQLSSLLNSLCLPPAASAAPPAHLAAPHERDVSGARGVHVCGHRGQQLIQLVLTEPSGAIAIRGTCKCRWQEGCRLGDEPCQPTRLQQRQRHPSRVEHQTAGISAAHNAPGSASSSPRHPRLLPKTSHRATHKNDGQSAHPGRRAARRAAAPPPPSSSAHAPAAHAAPPQVPQPGRQQRQRPRQWLPQWLRRHWQMSRRWGWPAGGRPRPRQAPAGQGRTRKSKEITMQRICKPLHRRNCAQNSARAARLPHPTPPHLTWLPLAWPPRCPAATSSSRAVAVWRSVREAMPSAQPSCSPARRLDRWWADRGCCGPALRPPPPRGEVADAICVLGWRVVC